MLNVFVPLSMLDGKRALRSRKGLEKALFQIEQALKRVKSGEQNDEDSRALFDLQNLLVETKDHPSVSSSTTRLQRRETVDGGDDLSTDEDDETEDTPDSNAYVAQHREGSLTIDDAENPLQLLARASNLQLSPTPGGPSPGQVTKSGRKKLQPEQPDEDTEIQSFFTSVRVNLDVGDEIDPISMGLVTEAEAEDLFTYGVINHPTAPIEVRQFFRTAGMSSALTVLRVAIQGEARLQSMPNNTCIMIAFAACFALTLSAYASGSSNLAPSVRNLIEQTACVLERVGNKTKHRNGLSTLYGKYLRGLTRKAATAAEEHSVAHLQPAAETLGAAQFGFATIPASSDQSLAALGPAEAQPGYPQPPSQSQLWPETLQFSTMSDEQIIEILNQPHNAFDPAGANLSWEDMDNFEGLNWPNLPGFNY
ncbi:hypothetical protein ACHAO3_006652 [Verticillium nonalfalfae]